MAHPLSLRGVYNSLRWPQPRDLLFSTKAFLATAIALLFGFSQDLQNPYWAVLTIYIVLTPPESGAIRSKALFRLVGTVGGGCFIMIVTALFGDQLGIQVAVIIAVISVCVYLRQIDRTPTNYMWFAAGITTGVIGLTNLMQPLLIFDFATARMGEISLGILVIAAVDSMLWPRAMTGDFLETVSTWRATARTCIVEALGRRSPWEIDEVHRKKVLDQLRDLTKEVGVIDAKAVQLPFDIVPFAPRTRDLNLVRRQVVSLIADLTAIEAWTRSFRHVDSERRHIESALAVVSAWVSDSKDLIAAEIDGYNARGEAIIATLESLHAGLDPNDRNMLMERGMTTRLIAFVRDWSDLNAAVDAVESGRQLPSRLDRMARHARPVRSVDYVASLRDVAPLAVSMSITTTIWYFTAWQSGASALLFSFVGCIFFIGQRSILQAGTGLVTWIIIAFAFVFVYDYAILPRVTDFPVLIGVLGVAMLPFGLLMTMSMAGMLMCVYIFAFLGLQDVYAADISQTLLTLSSALVGLFIGTASLYVFDYDRAAFTSRRLVRAVRRDIVDLARSRRLPSRERLLFMTVDRLALYFPLAEQVAAGQPLPRLGMLDDLRLGMNLLILRELAPHAAPAVREAIQTLRVQTVAAFVRKPSRLPGDDELIECIDRTMELEALRHEPRVGDMREALLGMRLALSQDSQPYRQGSPVDGT